MIRFQKSRRRRSVLAVAESYWWVIRNFSLILKKRRLVQESRLIHDSFLRQHGLMLSYIQSLREFARLSSARRRYPSLFISNEQGPIARLYSAQGRGSSLLTNSLFLNAELE